MVLKRIKNNFTFNTQFITTKNNKKSQQFNPIFMTMTTYKIFQNF